MKTTKENTGRKLREFEVEPRVHEIEQQLQEHLPAEWRQFAGKPIRMTYYDTSINTFKSNPTLKPSDAYVKWALNNLRTKLEEEGMALFNDDELREIVHQEWRTDMTRNVWEGRLNRHGSKDGPVVRRSRCGVIYVADQPDPGKVFVADGMTHIAKKKSK